MGYSCYATFHTDHKKSRILNSGAQDKENVTRYPEPTQNFRTINNTKI